MNDGSEISFDRGSELQQKPPFMIPPDSKVGAELEVRHENQDHSFDIVDNVSEGDAVCATEGIEDICEP